MGKSVQREGEVATTCLAWVLCRRAACPEEMGAGGCEKVSSMLVYDECEEDEKFPLQKFAKLFTRNVFFFYYVPHKFDVGKFSLQNECIFLPKYFIISPSCLLSGVSVQQDITTDIIPNQRTSTLSLISYRCLHECMHSAQHLRKWKMGDRLVDMFRDHRGPRPSEKEKGANRYESPLMGQAVC